MSKTQILPDVITADEAAKYLRVSKATVLRLSKKGLLQGVRIGRQWRFSRKSILHIVRYPELLPKFEATA